MNHHRNGRVLVLACTLIIVSLPLGAIELGFLSQGPVRYFEADDLEAMSATVDRVLEATGEHPAEHWANERTGNSGSVALVRQFEQEGNPCRRIELTNTSRSATRGGATSLIDLCLLDGIWKIVGMP